MRFTLAVSFFVLLTTPIALIGLLNSENLDPSSDAQSAPVQCNIEFPYVNTSSLEKGKTVQVALTVQSTALGKMTVKIDEFIDNTVYSNELAAGTQTFTDTFTYTPSKVGDVPFKGTVAVEGGSTYNCILNETNPNV